VRIGNDALGIEEILEADAVTGWAGAGRAVEREHLRLERRDAVAADRARLARRKEGFFPGFAGLFRLIRREARGAAREFECRFERFRQPLRGVGPDAQAVHHHLDRVFFLRVDLRQCVQLVHAPVDACAHEPLSAHLLENFRVFALAIYDHRREQQDREPLRQLHDLVDHLAHGLRGQIVAMVGAARNAGAREQQA
jgi:hypothetical protein